MYNTYIGDNICEKRNLIKYTVRDSVNKISCSPFLEKVYNIVYFSMTTNRFSFIWKRTTVTFSVNKLKKFNAIDFYSFRHVRFQNHGGKTCSTCKFFFLNCFWWNRSPYCLYFPLPPLRGQPTAKCHPRWQPISGQQFTVGWRDWGIQSQDCSFTIWCRYQWATTAP